MSELKFYEYTTTNNPKYLVVFLHGYGANGENLIDLAHQFKEVAPEAHFISPNAVEQWEGGFPNCYQWFSLYDNSLRKPFLETVENIKKSNIALQKFVDEQLARFNLELKDLILVGFSQGAMMSIYQSLIRNSSMKAVIAYSGGVILPENIGEKTISKPNICLVHGEEDVVVPFENFIEGVKILEDNNIPFKSHSIKGLDHSINLEAIEFGKNFLKEIINK